MRIKLLNHYITLESPKVQDRVYNGFKKNTNAGVAVGDLGKVSKKRFFWDFVPNLGRWGSKVPNFLVKITS